MMLKAPDHATITIAHLTDRTSDLTWHHRRTHRAQRKRLESLSLKTELQAVDRFKRLFD